jgi:hypothetical protein
MLRALCVDHGHSRQEGGMNCRTCQRRVATLLALPAVRAVLAAQEKLRRVEALAAEWIAASPTGLSALAGAGRALRLLLADQPDGDTARTVDGPDRLGKDHNA